MSKGVLVEKAWHQVAEHNLGAAIVTVRQMPELALLASGMDRLGRIEEDYKRMLSYMVDWYDDPKRGELYCTLLYQLWQLVSDIDLAYKKANVRSYIDASAIARHANMSYDFIRSVLEKYVTDMTMMSLDVNINVNDNLSVNGNGRQELLQRHHAFLSRVFHSLWTSSQWHDGDREFYSELLASPSIDTNDAITLTGAVLLGLSETFDVNKLRTLVSVYRHAENEEVRQTALVGVLLGLPKRRFSFEMLDEVFAELTGDNRFIDEVANLQVQILNCMNAENDRQIIEKEIMPTLVKNSNVSLGNLGLLDDGQSSVEDILNPERQEQMMEEMEEKASMMMKMQQEGADVYFGGFAQAKRSQFFNEMVNWWVPFTVDHPSIPQQVRETVEKSRFLKLIIAKGPFCHSDKYSLLSMGARVVGSLPKEIEKLDGDEAFVEAEIHGGTTDESAASIRRYYLQNMYRFYKLYNYRDDFRNPFTELFILDGVFSADEWNKAKMRVGRKLMKHKRWTMLVDLMNSCEKKDGEAWYMLGSGLMHSVGGHEEALDAFRKALEEMPDNDKILRQQARVLFLTGDYAGAEQTYLLLYEKNEDRPTYGLNACISMIRQGRYDEALKLLYQLDYKYEGNKDIQKHIAWAQLMVGKTEKALELFRLLTKNGGSESPECYLGLGYCHWFVHDLKSAVKSFNYFCKLTDASVDDLAYKLLDDIQLLTSHGIDTSEVYMVADLCRY